MPNFGQLKNNDKWSHDPDRGWVMPEIQREFLEWLVDPSPDKGTQKDWVQSRGYHEDAAIRWKRHPLFKAAMEKRYAELNISPDRVQAVMDSLWKQAVNGNTRAAELYLRVVEKHKAPVNLDAEKGIEELSDEELFALVDSSDASA